MSLPFFVYTKYFDKKGIIFLFLCKKITWFNPQSDNIQTKKIQMVSASILRIYERKSSKDGPKKKQ